MNHTPCNFGFFLRVKVLSTCFFLFTTLPHKKLHLLHYPTSALDTLLTRSSSEEYCCSGVRVQTPFFSWWKVLSGACCCWSRIKEVRYVIWRCVSLLSSVYSLSYCQIQMYIYIYIFFFAVFQYISNARRDGFSCCSCTIFRVTFFPPTFLPPTPILFFLVVLLIHHLSCHFFFFIPSSLPPLFCSSVSFILPSKYHATVTDPNAVSLAQV